MKIILEIITKLDNFLYKQFSILISTEKEPQRNLYSLFRLALIFTAIVFIFNLTFNNLNKLGEWGDFFGGVLNPILTFLTFMGLLITIVLQQKELKQSRKEFQGQKESLENQEFDNKFFQMLHLFNKIKDNLQLEPNRGVSVMHHLKTLMIISCASNNSNENIEEDSISMFKDKFKKFNNKYDVNFKYYFLNLYQILKYIDRHKDMLTSKEYSSIVRAQLSKDELVLLFYNAIGIIDISGNKYKKLVENYSMFEHLTKDDIMSFVEYNSKKVYPDSKLINDLILEYEEEAFGSNNDIKNYRKKLPSPEFRS